jgi:hypothetical protein
MERPASEGSELPQKAEARLQRPKVRPRDRRKDELGSRMINGWKAGIVCAEYVGIGNCLLARRGAISIIFIEWTTLFYLTTKPRE